jgi:SecD/SecF fusion protein
LEKNNPQMQNKGLITVFAIALGLASLYQLSFTWVANNVASDAEEFAAGDSKVKATYLDSMMTQEVYPVLGFTYSEVKKREMNLGLDLKGGMNVILEVSVKDVLKGLVANAQDPVFVQAIANTDAAQSEGQNNYLNSFFAEFDRLSAETGRSLVERCEPLRYSGDDRQGRFQRCKRVDSS